MNILLIFLLGNVIAAEDFQLDVLLSTMTRLVHDSWNLFDEMKMMTEESGLEKKILAGSVFEHEAKVTLQFDHDSWEELSGMMSRLRDGRRGINEETDVPREINRRGDLFIHGITTSINSLPVNTESYRINHYRSMLTILYRDWARWRQSFRSYCGLQARSPQGPLGVFRSTTGDKVKMELLPGFRMNLHIHLLTVAVKGKVVLPKREISCPNIRYHYTWHRQINLVDDDALMDCLSPFEKAGVSGTSFLLSYDPETNTISGDFDGAPISAIGDDASAQDPDQIADIPVTEGDIPYGKFKGRDKRLKVVLEFGPNDKLHLLKVTMADDGGQMLEFTGQELSFVIDSNKVLLIADWNFKVMVSFIAKEYTNGMIRIRDDPLEDAIIVKVRDREIVCSRIFD